MLKPLETEFKGRRIVLECTHKRRFPPPQMYGSTRQDIDTLWKQGVIDQNQYQHLKVWDENCGQMVMGPKCLDCPLALKQNPRPGRPNVIETENWLEAKNRIHWEDMKAGKLAPASEDSEAPEPGPEPTLAEALAQGNTGTTEVVIPPEPVEAKGAPKGAKKKRSSKKKPEAAEAEDKAPPKPVPPPAGQPPRTPSRADVASRAENLDIPPTEEEQSTVPDKKAFGTDTAPDLDEGILDALADD